MGEEDYENSYDDEMDDIDNRGKDHTGAEAKLEGRINQKNKTILEQEKSLLQAIREEVQVIKNKPNLT